MTEAIRINFFKQTLYVILVNTVIQIEFLINADVVTCTSVNSFNNRLERFIHKTELIYLLKAVYQVLLNKSHFYNILLFLDQHLAMT